MASAVGLPLQESVYTSKYQHQSTSTSITIHSFSSDCIETADGSKQKIDEMDANIKLLKKQVAGSEATNEIKHKIEEMDASIEFLRKQAAENDETWGNAARADPNVTDEQIEVALAMGVEHDGMRAIAQGKKRQKELTDEQKH